MDSGTVREAWGDLGMLQQPDPLCTPGMWGRRNQKRLWKPPPGTLDHPLTRSLRVVLPTHIGPSLCSHSHGAPACP